MMIVGEQPGDKEDLAGRPFVGPAGRLLDECLAEAAIARERIFVTNAVKHFKFTPRGKRRLHSKPNAGEIDQCRWWLGQELKLVAPWVVAAMGATALRGLMRRPVTVKSLRGTLATLEEGAALVATIHPSWLLRLRDPEDRQRERSLFVEDLLRAWQMLER